MQRKVCACVCVCFIFRWTLKIVPVAIKTKRSQPQAANMFIVLIKPAFELWISVNRIYLFIQINSEAQYQQK